MKGMIKFYNKDKGFGFVVGENNQDYYFNQKVIPFGHIPNSGDMIEFEVSDKPTSNKHKEPTIAKMTLTGEQATGMNNPSDSRVECPHCHKRVMPRVVTHYGRAERSLCPLCGGVVAEFVQRLYLNRLVLIAAGFVIIVLFALLLGTGNAESVIAFIPIVLLGLAIYWVVVYKPGRKNKVKV